MQITPFLPKGEAPPHAYLRVAVSDPVADAGRLIAVLNRKLNEDQDAGPKLAARNGERYRLTEDVLLELIRDAASEIASAPATSLEGAMAQVMLTMSIADDLATWAPENVSSEWLPRVTRCLYSVLGFLSCLSGTDPVSLGAEAYMSDRSNPWNSAQAA